MKVEAMLWVLILVSLALAIVSRRYRKYGVMAVGIGVVSAVVVIVIAKHGEREQVGSPVPPHPVVQRSKRVEFEQFHIDRLDQDDPQAKTRIAVQEIRFDQIRPESGFDPATIELVRARLYNDSARFALTDYAYYLVVQDCLADVCTTVYDQRGLAAATVPPNQARDVTIAIRSGESRETPPFKLLGTPKVLLSPTDTRAYLSASAP